MFRPGGDVTGVGVGFGSGSGLRLFSFCFLSSKVRSSSYINSSSAGASFSRAGGSWRK